MTIRDISMLRDKNELASQLSYLENELIEKTEDFNRNGNFFCCCKYKRLYFYLYPGRFKWGSWVLSVWDHH